MAEFPSWGSGAGSPDYLVSLDRQRFFHHGPALAVAIPGLGLSEAGVAGEPSVPAFVTLGDFSGSPLPALIYGRPI